MNALIAPTQCGQTVYFDQICLILEERTKTYFKHFPFHEFMTNMAFIVTHGQSMPKNRHPWEHFKHYFANPALPINASPLGVHFHSDGAPFFTFNVSQTCKGRLAGESFMSTIIISSQNYRFDTTFSNNLESRITDKDWRDMAKSIRNKYLLFLLSRKTK